MILESDAKFEEKVTCGLGNDMKNLADFQQRTQKSQNWDYYWVLFIQSRKLTSLTFTRVSCVMTMKNDTTF